MPAHDPDRAIRELNIQNEKLRKRVEALEAGLQPFADEFNKISADANRAALLMKGAEFSKLVSVSDLRRAAALLEKEVK